MATRVLLADGLPRMLHDLLVKLAKDEGLDVVDAVLSNEEIDAYARAGGSQVVVFPDGGHGLPDWASDLLERHPRLRFLALDPAGRSGDLFEFRLVHTRIDEISADALIATLQEPEGHLELRGCEAGR